MKITASGMNRNRDRSRTIADDYMIWYRTKGRAWGAFKLELDGSSLGGSYRCEIILSPEETRELVRGHIQEMTLEEVVRMVAD